MACTAHNFSYILYWPELLLLQYHFWQHRPKCCVKYLAYIIVFAFKENCLPWSRADNQFFCFNFMVLPVPYTGTHLRPTKASFKFCLIFSGESERKLHFNEYQIGGFQLISLKRLKSVGMRFPFECIYTGYNSRCNKITFNISHIFFYMPASQLFKMNKGIFHKTISSSVNTPSNLKKTKPFDNFI